MSSEIAHLLDRVKKVATRAIEAERNDNLEVAFDQFLLAAEILNKMIAMVDIKKIRDSYYTKAKEYIARAKELKIIIDHRKQEATDTFPSFDDEGLPSPPKTEVDRPKKDTFPSPSEEEFPSPPSERSPSKSTPPPPPPPPEDSSSQDDVMKRMMRGEEPSPSPPKDTPKKTPPPPPPAKKETPPPPAKKETPPPKKISEEKKKQEIPTRTTFELFYDKGKYQECIKECAESVETELRMKLGAFDEHLTLGMLIQKGLEKGMTILREFRYVNILLNRIEHENYRPKKGEAKKAVDITNRILMG
ncbi:MAG: hypothetical protein GF308_20745 [Candidatus Heimdallarchaeota archaeon]|nr:hypothetical protein [Candidatus Heimdallarchaeota archaeon]